jgi:MFS family permease
MSDILAAGPFQPPVIRHRRFVLGRRASFWVSAGVVGHTLWTSAAPAMAYPLYAAQWHLNHATVTGIFAIYPIVVVAVLTAFGDLSDHIGRRTTMLAGLAASLAGVLLFALAPSVGWLFAGRALMGIGVGLTAGPSTAAMAEFSAAGQAGRASSVATAAQAVGFTAALLIGGTLIQYAPLPTHLSFWVLGGVLTVLFVAAWFLPRHSRTELGKPWRPRVPATPKSLRRNFAQGAIAVTAAYTHGVLVLSLGAQVAHDLVQSDNVLVNGAALSLFAIASGIGGIAGRSLAPRRAMVTGAAASCFGMVLFVAAVALHALPVFLAATTTAGIGYSLLFLGGIEAVNRAAPLRHRGGMFSALYLLAYLSMGSVALALGQVATVFGLALAVNIAAATIAMLGLVTIVLAAVLRAAV